MPDWSDQLCEVLDAQEPNLAAACHLAPGMDGQAFEEALGLLLRWHQVRELEARFARLGGPNPGSVYGETIGARENTARRLEIIMRVLNETLYEQFGQGRVDDERAKKAYGALLDTFGDPKLVVATTNYDRSVDAALDMLGRNVETGFIRRPGRVPTLEPARLMYRVPDVTPVLHLHGAVGWYEEDGTVRDHLGDQPFRASLGTPVVLYPDPDKDPTSDATVSLLWAEFRQALAWANHVLVLGHSLHDPALIRAIREAHEEHQQAGSLYKVAVTSFSAGSAARIKELLPFAIAIQTDFKPQLDIDMGAVAAFRG